MKALIIQTSNNSCFTLSVCLFLLQDIKQELYFLQENKRKKQSESKIRRVIGNREWLNVIYHLQ